MNVRSSLVRTLLALSVLSALALVWFATTVSSPSLSPASAATAVGASVALSSDADRISVATERAPLATEESLESACRLRVLESATLAAIADATVVANDDRGAEHSVATDPEGLCRLPHAGVWHVVASSPSHVRREFVGRIEAGELVLELEPAGSIEVLVSTESGQPLEGASVLLVPPLASGKPFSEDWSTWGGGPPMRPKWAALQRCAASVQHGDAPFMATLDPRAEGEDLSLGSERVLACRMYEALPSNAWRARTGRDGRARWSGLPKGAGYRVGWLDAGQVALQPHHEFEPYAHERGRWVARGGPVEDVTAPLEVRCGETTRVTATAFREGSIYGWIDTGGGQLIKPSVVKLFHQTLHAGGDGSDLETTLMETSVVPSMDGQFEFHGYRPGLKRISAHWCTEAGKICFASIEFEATTGETKDVGVLRAQRGADLMVRIVLRDSSGAEIAPADVFAQETSPVAVLSLDTLSEPADLPGAVAELIGIPLGHTVVLAGMPVGKAQLRARLADDYELKDRTGATTLREPDGRPVATTSNQIEELVFVVTRRVEQRVRILWDQAESVPRLEAYWRATPSGVSGRTDLRPPRQSSGMPEYRLQLAAGTYELLVHANTLESPRLDEGWYWKGRVEVPTVGGVLDIRLQRGAALTGEVLNADGSPFAGRPMSFALPGRNELGAPVWSYTAMTDAQGRYRISSVPPESELMASTGDVGIRSGAVGSETAIDMRRSR